MSKRLILIIILVFLLAGQVFAGGDRRKGSAGAVELRIPIGSRATGLGGSVIADVRGLESIYWNPAGISSIRGVEAMFSYLDYIADMKFTFAGVGVNLQGIGVLGFSARLLSVGDVVVTTEDMPMGTGEILNPNFVTLGISFSRQMTDRIFFGTTLNFVNEQISQVSTRGFAMDFGFQYVPGIIRGLRLGVVVKNIGPNMRFNGSNLNHTAALDDQITGAERKQFRTTLEDFELPSYFQIGISMDPYETETSKLTVMGSFRNNNFVEDEVMAGAEYSFNDMFFLRAGYTGSKQEEYLYGPSFGAGLKLQLGLNTFFFDYSFAQTSKFFGSNQWFSVRFAF